MRRLPTLDGWRGVAILAVLCCHIRWPFAPLRQLAPYGALGVHLFFTLSGFLITWRLLEESDRKGTVRWSNFYLRRACRILPPSLIYLAAVAALGFGAGLIPMNGEQVRACLFFYRNYLVLPAAESWYTGHYWSLAVEEQFYMLWPAMLMIAGLKAGQWAAPVLALVVAIWRALDSNYLWIVGMSPSLRDYALRTDYLLDGLLWGCLLAFLWQRPRVRTFLARAGGTLPCIAALAAIAAILYWTPPGFLAILPVLMAVLPAATAGRPDSAVGRLLESRVPSFIGRISYSLYLWQQLFLPFSGLPLALGWLQRAPLNLAGAFTVATASYWWVERPFIAWGRRIEKRREAKIVGRAYGRIDDNLPKLLH